MSISKTKRNLLIWQRMNEYRGNIVISAASWKEPQMNIWFASPRLEYIGHAREAVRAKEQVELGEKQRLTWKL
jgi:hypothetical protein